MNYVCLMGINPKEVQKCNASECPTCGWEAAEAERRRAYLREHGLTLCADGLLRKGQNYALHRVCAQAARGLYRDKHAIGGGRVPAQYIADQEAAEEYFAMFRDFADVFQKHYLDRKDKPCKTSD